MNHRLVAHALELLEQPTRVPFGTLHLLGRLLLRNLPLARLLQCHQPVSIPLCHGENSSVFHLPSLIPSIGHFYLALIGHSHVAATPTLLRVDFAERRGYSARDSHEQACSIRLRASA